jgi:tetratricopeptide (TPR) repeat protein
MRGSMILIIFYASLFAQSPDSLFNRANRYFEIEQFEAAARAYEKLSAQVEHEDLYLNLGNAYFRIGNIGQAIWAYEKGHILSPRDQDIHYNLNYVQAQVRDRIQPPDDFFLVAYYRAIMEKLTILDLLTIGGILFMGLGVLYMIRNNGFIFGKIDRLIQSVLITAVIATGWIMLDKYWAVSEDQAAIVISSVVDVRSVPIARGENVVFRIHEGTKVDISTSQPGWIEVILLDGKKGWIPSEDVRTL